PQRERRRGGARTSHRRLRRARAGDADPRAAQARQEARPRVTLPGRRQRRGTQRLSPITIERELMPSISRVSVIGAGTMGAGIAQVCAQAGLAVKLIDVKEEYARKGLATINASLDRMVKKETINEARKKEIAGRVRTDVGLDGVSGSDLVIEAINENVELKT